MADSKLKVHTVYKLRDGTRVPSVTTILSVIDKPYLLDWSWRMGRDGLDYKAVRDDAADAGTLAHYFVMCHLKGEKPETSQYSPDVVNRAENCLIKYWDWEKEHKIEPVLVETGLVSETHRFGGTIDCLAKCDDKLWLVDYKTGKNIYVEMVYQLAAYTILLEENGYQPDNVRILRIGRDDTESFEERVFNRLDKAKELFLTALKLYNLQKEVK
jgi:RecB family exonuclease